MKAMHLIPIYLPKISWFLRGKRNLIKMNAIV